MPLPADSPGPQPTQQLSRRQYAWKEFKDLFRGREERHRRLHGRLLAVLLLSVILDIVFTIVLYFWGQKPTMMGGVGRDFPRAFIYVTEQIVSGGSSYMVFMTSWWEHAIEVFLDIYMVTVIAAVAGSFASYFTSE